MAQKAVQEEKAEDCEVCKIATGVGLALNVCETVLKPSGTDCAALKKDFDEGKIDEDGLFDTLIEKAATVDQDAKADLEEIRRLAKGEPGEQTGDGGGGEPAPEA